MDGSSRIVEGERKSGYAIIGGTDLRVIESGALDKSWSAQACELYAILRALTLLKGKEGTIYTDSKYGFGVVHTFGKLWEERGLINSQGKGLIHQKLIVEVLQALRGPKKIAVVHLRGHQPGIDFKSRGNNAADQEAKRAAVKEMVLKEKPQIRETLEKDDVELIFTNEEKEKLRKMGVKEDRGKWLTEDGREVLPKAVAQRMLYRLHQGTHTQPRTH